MIRITGGATQPAVYKIYIDGVYRGKVKKHETIEFEVENGSHTVYARCGVTSNTLHVDVNDSVVELEVGAEAYGWKELLSSLPSDLYVKVKGTETEAQRERREKRAKRPKWLQKVVDIWENGLLE